MVDFPLWSVLLYPVTAVSNVPTERKEGGRKEKKKRVRTKERHQVN